MKGQIFSSQMQHVEAKVDKLEAGDIALGHKVSEGWSKPFPTNSYYYHFYRKRLTKLALLQTIVQEIFYRNRFKRVKRSVVDTISLETAFLQILVKYILSEIIRK